VEHVRERVVEHRLTRTRTSQFWTIRFWVESDSAHGGVTENQALIDVTRAMNLEGVAGCKTPREMAEFLVDHIPAANSVEVCDVEGRGTVVYRNWP